MNRLQPKDITFWSLPCNLVAFYVRVMLVVWNSFLLVFVGEMGDKTQLLSLILAARYQKPWTILGGVLVATLLNHALASLAGAWLSGLLSPQSLAITLGVFFLLFALWILVPDKDDGLEPKPHLSVFVTTAVAFFFAEMGDKTQLATVALGARYHDVTLVTVGTTAGMLASNALAVFLGPKLLSKVPMQWVRRFAALLFAVFGVAILLTAFQ